MKVCFETFGCRLNKAEALQMEAEYCAKGWELADRHSDADLIVVRGCSVTARAQRDCEKLIARLRRQHPDIPVKVCGCLENADLDISRSVRQPKALPTRTARAYLKVQDGCSGRCTFCIVPRFRGRSESVPFSAVLDRARRFLDSGYREIVVTGCNLSLYASDGKCLPELVAALSELSPSNGAESCRIRLGSLEPGPCATDTIHAIAEHENACRFLHIPFQSGSDRVLRAMRRPYRADDVVQAAETARKLLHHPGLGCDVMAGFPGESDRDHEATKGLLKRLAFSNAHVFPFSERPGTPAATFPDSVPTEVRSRRARELTELAQSARDAFARSCVGRIVDVLVEDESETAGWTDEYLWCRVRGSAPRKTRIRVLVTACHGDQLHGETA